MDLTVEPIEEHKETVKVNNHTFDVFYKHKANNQTYKNQYDIIYTFSKAKLGDYTAIKEYATQISVMIQKHIINTDNTIIINNPSSIKRNTAYCIAEEVSNILNIPFSKVLHLRKISTSKYYTKMNLQEKTDIMKQTLYFEGNSIKDKNIILIDDCITSGTIIKSCIQKLLEQNVNKIYPFVYLKISSTQNEDLFGKEILLKEGINGLIDIISKDGNYITTRLIGVIFELNIQDIVKIIKSLSPQKSQKLVQTMIEKVKRRKTLVDKMQSILNLL